MPRFLEMERKYGSLIRGMRASRRTQASGPQKHGGARYSQFMTLRGGMSRLIDAPRDSLPAESVHLNTPITKLTRTHRGWCLEDRGGRRRVADAVVIASPARHAAPMLRRLDPRLADQLASIEYASCAVVSLAFRRDQIKAPLNAFGFVVPHVERRFILSCSFSSEKYEGRAPGDTVLMRVFIGGAMQQSLLRMPDEQLLELAHWEVADLLDIDGDPIMRHLTRQLHAMPQYHVGHTRRIAEITERLDAHPTLALAGSSLTGVGVPGCIASGKQAAARVLAGLHQSTPTPPTTMSSRPPSPPSLSPPSNARVVSP